MQWLDSDGEERQKEEVRSTLTHRQGFRDAHKNRMDVSIDSRLLDAEFFHAVLEAFFFVFLAGNPKVEVAIAHKVSENGATEENHVLSSRRRFDPDFELL